MAKNWFTYETIRFQEGLPSHTVSSVKKMSPDRIQMSELDGHIHPELHEMCKNQRFLGYRDPLHILYITELLGKLSNIFQLGKM